MQSRQSDGDDDDAVLREALAFIGDFDFDDDATPDFLGDSSPPHDENPGAGDLVETENSATADALSTAPPEAAAVQPRVNRPHSYSRRRSELQYLRSTVEELELRLGTLRKRFDDQRTDTGETFTENGTRQSPLVVEAWERVAQHQYEQRHQSEIENIKLKRLLEDQIQVGKALERVLSRKRPRGMEMLKLQSEKLPPAVPSFGDTSQLFQDLFASIDKQYLETNRVHAKVAHTCPSVNHHDVRLVHDADAGLVLQSTECHVFPFAYKDTVQALWDSIMDVSVHGPHHIDKTDEQQKLQLRVEISLGSVHAAADVFIASRRYTEATRTVMVSAAVIDPREIADVNMDGIQMRHQGWSIVEPLPPSERPRATQHATRKTVYATASPVINGSSVQDPTRKTGTLTNFVMSALSFDKEARHTTLENRLFERSLGLASMKKE